MHTALCCRLMPAVLSHKDPDFWTWQCLFPVAQLPSKVTLSPTGPSIVPRFSYLYREEVSRYIY